MQSINVALSTKQECPSGVCAHMSPRRCWSDLWRTIKGTVCLKCKSHSSSCDGLEGGWPYSLLTTAWAHEKQGQKIWTYGSRKTLETCGALEANEEQIIISSLISYSVGVVTCTDCRTYFEFFTSTSGCNQMFQVCNSAKKKKKKKFTMVFPKRWR